MSFWQKLKEKWRIANEKHDKKWKDIDRYLAGDKTIKIPKLEKFILVTLPEILEKIFPKFLWGVCAVLVVACSSYINRSIWSISRYLLGNKRIYSSCNAWSFYQ